jgi:pimeloyl-[acyl-carrier protein] methyl ester esterase
MTTPLHVETRGAGADLVLLHGWGMHGDVWGDFASRLAESHRVSLIDLPGYGFSSDVGVPVVTPTYTLDSLFSTLLENTPQRAVWLGWSLGGALAALLAAQHPQRVGGLILLACNPCFVRRADWPWGMEEAVFNAFATEVENNHAAGLRRFTGLLCQGLAEPRSALKNLRERLETRPAPDARALNAGLELLRALDVRPELSRLACPVLLAGGERDALMPFGALRALAELHPSIRLARIAGASHVPFLSHEEETLASLRPFLDECTGRP